jgi:hypothetical protein
MAGAEFSINLARICNRYKGDIKLAMRKITMEAFKRVILRTPVDTGRARANWSVTEGAPGTTYQIEAVDKAGNKTVSTAVKLVDGWECKGPIFLSNNVSYILPLEYGHSKQSPGGMVRWTVAEMQAWVRSVKL